MKKDIQGPLIKGRFRYRMIASEDYSFHWAIYGMNARVKFPFHWSIYGAAIRTMNNRRIYKEINAAGKMVSQTYQPFNKLSDL